MPRLPLLALAVFAAVPVRAGVFPDAAPANRAAASAYGPRSLALGEPRFVDAQFYNLYDQGGSPMGLLETRKERLGISLGYAGSHRATSGDSLTLDHSDLSVPQIGFFQPGVFGASLYFMREAEDFRLRGGDTVGLGASLFGLDMAAGPASGLFRVGFSAHARMGGIEYPGDPKRILVGVPSLRFDLGSRPLSALEVVAFGGFGGRFDSLKAPSGNLERVATMTLPRYGLLADVGGTEELPAMGNVVVELGTDRAFGEYRPANGTGVQYPTIWTDYWTFQTQWMYPFLVEDFRLQPALRFAHRSDKAQGYEGLKGNQDPFKKGPKIATMHMTRGITDFGLGGQVAFKEMVSLLMEWETSGHAYESDTTGKTRYNRFSAGVEHKVHLLPIDFPKSVTLALRAGWTWRQDAGDDPGYRDFHFDPFLPAPEIAQRPVPLDLATSSPAGYSAFGLGLSLGLFEERLGLDGYISFPGQPEKTVTPTRNATGSEFGISLGYRLF